MSIKELFVLMNSNQHDSVRYIQGLVDMQRFIYLSEKNIPNKKILILMKNYAFVYLMILHMDRCMMFIKNI